MIEKDPDMDRVLDRIAGCGTYEWHVLENRLVWSEGLTKLYGLRRPPSTERGFLQLVHPEDRIRIEAEISSFLETGDSYEHEFRIVRPDGHVRYIHDRGTIERDADGRARFLHGLNVDVTRAREIQVMEQETRLGTARGIGFYEYDVAQAKPWWSEGMFRILDLPPDRDLDLDRITEERVHPEDRDRLRGLQYSAYRRLGPFEIEYRFFQRDGEVRWIRDRGETVGALDPANGMAWRIRGTITDITESKRTHPATPAGSETFRQVIEGAPFGICVIDADFRLVQVSAGAREAFGGIDALIGRDYRELLRSIWSEPFVSDVVARIRNTLDTGETYRDLLAQEHRRDRGADETYAWALEQIRLPDGRPGVACYFYDLSDRTAQEAVLRENEERLHLSHEAANMGAWDLDLASGDVIWTSMLYELLGLDPTTPASTNLFFEMIHPEDRETVKSELERSIESGGNFDAMFRVRRPDGDIRHIAGRGRVIRHDGNRPVRMIGVNFDVTERHRMERKARDSAERLRLVLDNALAFIGLLDLEGRIVEANAMALEAGGVGRDEIVGKLAWETYGWSYDPEVADRLRASIARAATGEVVRYDAVARTSGDGRVTIDMLLSPIIYDDGSVREIVVSGFDVTEREKAKEHAEFLMREINHRAKNTLSLVQAIARQIWQTDSGEFLSRFEGRLRALAHSHDLLVNDDWNGVRLGDLVRGQLAHFEDLIGTRIHLQGPKTAITAEAAQTLGMAFHELATNAGKYGALSQENGHVDIIWNVSGAEHGDRRLTVCWTERGGPPVEPPTRKGFGNIVLDRLVKGAFSGEVELAYPPKGFRWRFTCSDTCLLPQTLSDQL
ncbi:PAS domain-containing protein [Limimaricola litoreus]|uniref:histidine kinase n=1 Tax=Limimaricola litoreus TaxID=2955316 RepID=A0A9X2FMM8_9RHOB|nr:PAS domain-containing protein [Limimaricola litoreus]MCP1167366.1 PAS domain-containing protein [Limimaricola litoreus]